MRNVFILFLLFFITTCGARKDDTQQKAILNFAMNCPGGNATSCTNICARDKCGVPIGSPITATALSCVTSCQSNCSSYCDLSSLLLLYIK